MRRGRHGLRRPHVPPVDGVPELVPVPAAGRPLRHALLPPERGPQRHDMPRHTQGQVVGAVRRQDDTHLHTEPARRAERGQPAERARVGTVGRSARVQKIFRRLLCQA